MTEPVGYLQYHRDYESGVLEVEFVESKDEDLEGGLYEYTPVVLAASLADAQAEIARLRGALDYVEECLSSAKGSSALDDKMIDRALNGVRQAKP